MKGLKNLLPLLLLAVAATAIPLPEARSFALGSAQQAALVQGAEEGEHLEKREVRGDVGAAETEEMEATTEGVVEVEETLADAEDATMEKEDEEEVGEEELKDGMTTTEKPEETTEAQEAEEEEEEKAEEKPEEGDVGKEEDEEERKEAEEEEKEKAVEGEKGEEEEGGKGPAVEEGEHQGSEEVPSTGDEDEARPAGDEEEGPLFAFGHSMEGPFPWPWGSLPPLDQRNPVSGLPDHPVQPVGNEVWSPRKVVVPVYLIRIDHRYLQGSPYQGL